MLTLPFYNHINSRTFTRRDDSVQARTGEVLCAHISLQSPRGAPGSNEAMRTSPLGGPSFLFRVELLVDAEQVRHVFQRLPAGLNEAIADEEECDNINGGQYQVEPPRNGSADRRCHLSNDEVGYPKRCGA